MPRRSIHAPARAGALALALGLALAGCAASGDGGGSGDAAPTTAAPAAPSGTSGTSAPPAAVASAGCGTSTQGAVTEQERTLTVADQPRRYLLTVPEAHDGTTPLPVVFDFHGLMEGAEVHAGMSQYSALAAEEGFVAVFPHGTGTPIRWNANPLATTNDDLTYFDDVRAQLAADLCIDESRIYATGLSNGAMFTSILLCQRADVLAAAAPVAGITDAEDCDPARPVPIVAYHGTADPILLFNGGVDTSMLGGGDPNAPTTTAPPADLEGEGYPAAVAAFAARNGCAPEPTDTEVTAEVIHRVYDCPEGADVEFFIVLGGGHSWPGSAFSKTIGNIVGPTTFDIDATRDAWAFMSQFTNA
ncbi:MAG: prolyl oligopeptidase family serine peptidase [Acidimicrobiales bacterium]